MNTDFFKLNKIFRLDAYTEASEKKDIDALKNHFKGVSIPEDYLNFINQMSEAEILVLDEVYLRIWGAKGCLEINKEHHVQKYIPKSFAIGDDEGGQIIFYAEGNNGYGLYKVGFGNLDINDAEFIAPSLRSLLIDGVGAEILV
ncbi:SMI1/KNR4 family protein [Cronobacter dublinensis]|nr:SMI1/KNR4 family protein [Cronobacter dublinensis]ELY3973221.1 SMI1/KNR4 family protein [Cronobacter dublinensis]ELY4487754.1 SMI1/KNR4 family protein [Cronobacter dublinensis]ELY5824749.1 SMI1/KNR4 family protein [Cronobacter dublinensis]